MFKQLVLSFALVAVAFAAPAQQDERLPRLDGRIVGGQAVSISNYPWQISMQYYGQHICGGTIISNRYIVTAAHCTDGQSASALSVRAGSSQHASGGQVVKVSQIRQHPSYNSRTMSNDISILFLASTLTSGGSVQPARLPSQGQGVAAGTTATVTGWGYLYDNGPMPSNLQGVNVPIIGASQCKNAYAPANIDSTMICGGYLGVGGRDACQGDSGGPLVVGNTLVGVVSWGYGCADPNYPGVYAAVGQLRNFITQQTGV